MAKTIAISTEIPRKGGDVWQAVVGIDISLDEAVRGYMSDWSRAEKQDQENTKLAYVSIVPVPDSVLTQDVVKDGKLVVAE